MVIGSTTNVNISKFWADRMNYLYKKGFRHIEINQNDTRIRPMDIPYLMKWNEEKNLSFSFHSIAKHLTSGLNSFAKAEISILASEIEIAGKLGVKHLVFHLHETSGPQKAVPVLERLLKKADQNGVRLLVENNKRGYCSDQKSLRKLLSKFENLGFCLDLGHLQIAMSKEKGSAASDFVDSLAEYTSQVHVHTNNGEKDEHLGINEGSKFTLSLLDQVLSKAKTAPLIQSQAPLIVLEVKRPRELIQSYSLLKRRYK